MSKLISLEDLTDRWNKEIDELIPCIKDGLQPYDLSGKPKPPPGVAEIEKSLIAKKRSLKNIKSQRGWPLGIFTPH